MSEPVPPLASLFAALSALPEVPFAPYRDRLYSFDELTEGIEAGYDATLDARIAAYYADAPHGEADQLAQATHDASISTALDRLLTADGSAVVGVMGGHGIARTDPRYAEIAQLGRLLTRAGYLVATGGGPGVMEAANLGAWLAPHPDRALGDALTLLADVPTPDDHFEDYLILGLAARARWSDGGASLGVPTWVYAHEPTSPFSRHIAKYFANSVRENGLLAIATAGIVFAPGGPGTEQEIFTDAAQNSYTAYNVRSPIVFFDRGYYADAGAALVAGVRHQADLAAWPELVSEVDTATAALAAIAGAGTLAPRPRRPANAPRRLRPTELEGPPA